MIECDESNARAVYKLLPSIEGREAFSGGSAGKESACSAGDPSSIPGLGRSPGEGRGSPLQYSCLENPHGQRSMGCYSPWGHTESDTTERPSTAWQHRKWRSLFCVWEWGK